MIQLKFCFLKSKIKYKISVLLHYIFPKLNIVKKITAITNSEEQINMSETPLMSVLFGDLPPKAQCVDSIPLIKYN